MVRIRAATTHVFLAVLIAALAVGLVASTAFAAKGSGKGGGKPSGGGSTGGSFSLVMWSDANTSGSPNWGDAVTYDVSNVTVRNPYITTKCYQNGTLVLSSYAGFYDGYLWPAAKYIWLKSDLWTSGAGDCTAVLSGTSTTLSYHVDP